MRTIQHATARKLTTKQHTQHKAHRKSPKKPTKKLRAVEERRRQPRSSPELSFPVFVASVSVITAGMIINVAQQALVSQLSYEIDSVKKEIQVAQQVQDKLLAEKAILESPQRVELVATGKLSMVKAPKVYYLRINDVKDNPSDKSQLGAVAERVTR